MLQGQNVVNECKIKMQQIIEWKRKINGAENVDNASQNMLEWYEVRS